MPFHNPIKGIDWNMVSSNPGIIQQFTLAVKNSLEALSEPSGDIETTYNIPIKSTE